MSETSKMIEKPDTQLSTPAQLLQIAIQSGSELDRLEQLMDMQIKWETNEARKAFVKALSGFRSEAPTIGKNKKAHNSNYATIDRITETINPLLSDYDLSFSWSTEQAGDAITVHCDVTHSQGHSQRVSLTAAPDNTGSKNSIQAIGSTVSYLQRYTLLSALGLATGEHDVNGRASQAVDLAEYDNEVKQIESCTTLDELQQVWLSLPTDARKSLASVKDRMKGDLS